MTAIGKRQLLMKTLAATGGLRLLENVRTWSGLLALNYHRIGSSEGSPFDKEIWSATADDFDLQLSHVKSQFDVVGLDDLPSVMSELQKKQNWNKSRFAMITFDDGFRDNFEVAFPILQAHKIPALFFVTTGFIDFRHLAWWDEIAWMVRSTDIGTLPSNRFLAAGVDLTNRDDAIRTIIRRYYTMPGDQTADYLNFLAEATGVGRAPAELSQSMWMTWDHIREMRFQGMSFGAHTVNHRVLSQLSFEEQNFEICESRLRIEHELGESIATLSYPVGRRDSFNEDTRRALSLNSFDWAFSFYGGYCRNMHDRFDVTRIGIERSHTLTDFRSILALPQVLAQN